MFKRKKLWIIPIIVGLVAAICILTMPRLVAGATEEDRSETGNEPIPTVFACLHGELIPLTEGMVLDATDGCEILAKGSKYWNYNKVTTERTSDGWLVTEITWKHLKASPAPPKLPEGGEAKKAPVPKVKPANDKEVSALHGDRLATLSAVERLGWARTTVKWLFIPVTKTYGEMKYWDDGSQVYYGHDYDGECWYLPPYYIDADCDAWWWPNGPDVVYETTEGEYYPLTAHRHTARAMFYGYPGGEWDHSHYISDLPVGYSVVREADMQEL